MKSRTVHLIDSEPKYHETPPISSEQRSFDIKSIAIPPLGAVALDQGLAHRLTNEAEDSACYVLIYQIHRDISVDQMGTKMPKSLYPPAEHALLDG